MWTKKLLLVIVPNQDATNTSKHNWLCLGNCNFSGNDTFHNDNDKNLAKHPTHAIEISKETLAILAIEVNNEASNIDNTIGRNIIGNLQKFEIKLKSW